MRINQLQRVLTTLANAGTARREDAGEAAIDLQILIDEMNEAHGRQSATMQRAGEIDLVHALRIGIDETLKAHAIVEGQREAVRAAAREAESAASRAVVIRRRDAIRATLQAQFETVDGGALLALLGPGGGVIKTSTARDALSRVLDQCANNIASYTTLDSEEVDHG